MATATTISTRLISNTALATKWEQLTNSLKNPAKLLLGDELEQIAQDQSLDIGPVLGTFAQRLIDGRSPQPTTTTELLETFSLFITQGISDIEHKAVAFEQEFVRAFSNHAILRLRPQSFRTGSLDMTNDTLNSAEGLTDALGKKRLELEDEAEELKAAFNDPDGRIILAQDRIHAVSNALQVIKGYAAIMRKEVPEPRELREYLDAIKANVLSVAEGNRAKLAGNPVELYRRMNPRVEVTIEGDTPNFLDKRHPKLIVNALSHIVDNAFKAGAKNVRIKAEYKPSDKVFAIGIEDNGPGIPTEIRDQLVSGRGGSGWRILREVTLPRLDAHFQINSPSQNDDEKGPYGTLVLFFIPVVAKTGNEPGTGRRTHRADTGPVPAVNSIKTPAHEMPAVRRGERPVSQQVAGGAACFLRDGDDTGAVVLKFELP